VRLIRAGAAWNDGPTELFGKSVKPTIKPAAPTNLTLTVESAPRSPAQLSLARS